MVRSPDGDTALIIYSKRHVKFHAGEITVIFGIRHNQTECFYNSVRGILSYIVREYE